MYEILEVPNTLQQVTALVMATNSCDTLAMMVAIKAISSQDLQRVIDTKKFLREVSQKVHTHETPPPVEDDYQEYVLIRLNNATLCDSENQAYLAYKLKLELSAESLINALTDLVYCEHPDFQSRPWKISSLLRGEYGNLNIDEQRHWMCINMALLYLFFRSGLVPPYFKSSEQVFLNALRFLIEDSQYQ